MTRVTVGTPANVVGTTMPQDPVQGVTLLQNASKAVYAQETAGQPARMIGYIPVTSDGNGGIHELVRDFDCSYYPQTQTGFTASLSGTSLTVNYPTTPVLYSGVIQTLQAGSVTGTVSTGLWSLVVGYLWGLTQVQMLLTSSISPAGNYIELCEINVNTSTNTATVTNGMVNAKLLNQFLMNGPANQSFSIPVSDTNGNMAW